MWQFPRAVLHACRGSLGSGEMLTDLSGSVFTSFNGKK